MFYTPGGQGAKTNKMELKKGLQFDISSMYGKWCAPRGGYGLDKHSIRLRAPFPFGGLPAVGVPIALRFGH